MALSKRGLGITSHLDIPWRYAQHTTYDANTNPDGIIAFSTADNHPVSSESFTYWYEKEASSRFAKALVEHVNESLGPHWKMTEENVVLAHTATALNEMLGFALAEQGDAFLTTRPVYGRYELDFGIRAGVGVWYADTKASTCFQPDVVEALEIAMDKATRSGTKIRAMLIVNPHNPLGQCYPRETLVQLMRFCQSHRIHLISDEIFACTCFDSGEPDTVAFTSLLSIDPTGLIDASLCHVITGMSKDFAAGGLRIGAVLTQNQQLRRACRTQTHFNELAGPSLMLATAMLEDRDWCRHVLDVSQTRLAAAYRHVTSELRKIGVSYLPGSNAGFFIWVDLSRHLAESGSQQEREFQLAQKLLNNRVFLHPGEEHSMEPGWFRLVYTTSPAIVSEGVQRLARALK